MGIPRTDLLVINAQTLLTVALACVAGAYVTRLTAGLVPAFNIPDLAVHDFHTDTP